MPSHSISVSNKFAAPTDRAHSTLGLERATSTEDELLVDFSFVSATLLPESAYIWIQLISPQYCIRSISDQFRWFTWSLHDVKEIWACPLRCIQAVTIHVSWRDYSTHSNRLTDFFQLGQAYWPASNWKMGWHSLESLIAPKLTATWRFCLHWNSLRSINDVISWHVRKSEPSSIMTWWIIWRRRAILYSVMWKVIISSQLIPCAHQTFWAISI